MSQTEGGESLSPVFTMYAQRTSNLGTPSITRETAKAHCKVEQDQENSLIDGYLGAAAEYIYNGANSLAINQGTFEETFTDWPADGLIPLQAWPLVSVSSVKYLDEDNAEQTLETADYFYVTRKRPGCIVFREGHTLPTLGEGSAPIKVTYVAGCTSSTLPEMARLLVLMLVAQWYDQRSGSIIGTIAAPLEFAAKSMLQMLSSPRIH